MGRYVGTIFLIIRRDIPRIIGVFAVINFSFGAGLYFALVGHYDETNVDKVNDNSTRYMYIHVFVCQLYMPSQECIEFKLW